MSRRLCACVAAVAIALVGCQATPTAPPALDLPPATAETSPDLERWWLLFDDPGLTALIDEALAHNLDLQAAIARVDLARANLLLAQSPLYPSANLAADVNRTRQTLVGSQPLPAGFNPLNDNARVGVRAAYEVDVWGRYRQGAEAARNELLASEYARASVRTAVAAETARIYFGLLAGDAEVDLLRATLRSRDETVELQTKLYRAGLIGDYDLQRAEAERASVAANLALAERTVGSYETALAAIVGRSPREVFAPQIERHVKEARLLGVPEVPPGLPADLLERRPDIRAAEARIAAASLRIDAARAQYFPSLALTASYGSESAALADLFTGPALAWGIAGAVLQPLIGLKAIEASVQAETARREAALVAYVQTVQTAFREARDALVANRTMHDALVAQGERAGRLEASLKLADLRYRAGYSGYIEVLDAQRQLLQAQTLQILAARDVRFALVDLARAMGGGWDYRADAAAR
ncbi:efflux transporter outer membrane subunit [Accumulibacter sp.]|uniref:efflux transporter outer membrane subunit n=1 Tax=Accumulibacter sp. TaxID=2053492 RepID=UPI0025E88C2C|nr:efflux transporter outer membrane subunit [Accumulibacter sp.]MCM8594362.1 efflux transporter outer membrane subunit [Accumulibacter sp.]MCM8625003.1 efflux transporter outer membrane subunit [Accumulibacter sp.]MDS4048506.1 efflux transporter outer membrane subunit [Accumulibacter sp.]